MRAPPQPFRAAFGLAMPGILIAAVSQSVPDAPVLTLRGGLCARAAKRHHVRKDECVRNLGQARPRPGTKDNGPGQGVRGRLSAKDGAYFGISPVMPST